MPEVENIKNPFVGLRAFEEDEDKLFFGRDAEINDLLKKFVNSRLLAVVGSSGCGKSSLVKSGLLPAIYSGFLSAGRNWRVALFRPGDDPIGNMAKELATRGVLNQSRADAGVQNEPIIGSTLRRSTNGLIQVYQQAHFAATENLLIVIDQFEELFRYSKYEKQNKSGRSDAMHFVNLLITATSQAEYPVYVLITMRSDFIGDCAEFRGLPEAINKGQYLVPRMTREEIRQAINGPIAIGGATITQRLVTRLLNDVGNDLDQLPILQHALMRTWDEWQQKNSPDSPIDIENYEKIGGMQMALSLHAEEIYAELTPGRLQNICELIFKALTDKAADIRGIRRPTSIEDLCKLTNAKKEELIPIIEIFRKAGRTFLMPPPIIALHEKSIVDISHESLMRIWQRLVKWADEEAKSGSIYLELSKDALRYKQGEIALWTDPELGNALKWRDENKLNKKWAQRYNEDFDLAMAFLQNSEDEAKRKEAERIEAEEREKARIAKNLRTAKIVGAVFFGLLIVVAFLGFKAKDAGDKARKSAKLAQESLLASVKSAIETNEKEIRIDSINQESFVSFKAADVAENVMEKLGRLRIIRDSLNAERKRIDSLLEKESKSEK